MSVTTRARAASRLQALPAEAMVTGLPVVTVAVAPAELSARAGLSWSEVDSELGSARIIVVQLDDDGPRFALTSYDDAPSPVVTVAADGNATERDIDALLRQLKVRRSEVLDRVGVRPVDSAIGSRARAARMRQVNATRRALHVLAIIRASPGITVPELARRIAISERSLYRITSRLQDAGMVRKKGHGWHGVSAAMWPRAQAGIRRRA
jgi:DNA-binding transcriptional ArsR family regulator